MRLQMSTKNLDKTRWISLVAGFVLMSTLSLAYLWSLYVNPMLELGATDNWMSVVYNISVVAAIIFALLGGKMLDKWGSNIVMVSGLLSFLVGSIICGFTASNVMFFAVGFQVMAWGGAVIYIAVYANITKLFPDKRGTAVAIAGFGIAFGGTFIGPLAQWLIDSFGFGAQFTIIGIGLFVVGMIALIFFPVPEEGYAPAGYVSTEAKNKQIEGENLNDKFVQKDWRGMLKDPAAWMLFSYPILGIQLGMIITGNVTWMAEDMISISASKAAWLLSATMMASSIGKIISGVIGDIIGRLNLAIIIYGINVVASAGFVAITLESGVQGMGIFTVLCIICGLCFGASGALTPALTADLFGSKNFGFNFAIIGQASSIGSMITPWIAFIAKDDNSSGYFIVFLIALLMAITGVMFALYMKKTRTGKLEVVHKEK